jgi:hypothetical protein
VTEIAPEGTAGHVVPFHAKAETHVRDPIAIDNNRAIWSGFGNHYWPALYFIDATGRVRDHHFGEGNYEESEARIRQLLAASRSGPVMDGASVSIEAHGPEAGADWGSLNSPETYVGHSKAEMFASRDGAVVNTRHRHGLAPRLRLNQWALSGEWSVQAEAAVLNAAGGRVAYRFHARDLHLIEFLDSGVGGVRLHIRVRPMASDILDHVGAARHFLRLITIAAIVI